MNARKIRLVKGDNDSCPKCGDQTIASRTFSDTVDFRGLELDVEGLEESKCSVCNYVWTSPSQETQNNNLTRTAYARERDRLRAAHGLLSGSEIARIRSGLGLNQREAASLFGGGFNAFNKYESGEVLQSFAMDRLLRLAKIIGRPVVSFLKDVDALPSFVITVSSSTVTQSAYNHPHFVQLHQTMPTIGFTTSSTSAVQRIQGNSYEHAR